MTDENDPQQEPEPGSTEWLLAQLSGGRLDSRRERREAEAALEARGVQFDVTTGAITLPEQPGGQQPEAPQPDGGQPEAQQPEEQAGDESADERPKARFSWETGTLEAVGSPTDDDGDTAAARTRDVGDLLDDDRVLDDDGSLDDDDRAPLASASGDAPAPLSASAHPKVESRHWFDDPGSVPLTFESTFTAPTPAGPPSDSDTEPPFRWNLSPTADADPAVNPALEVPESVQSAVPAAAPSAAPLIVPKPLPQTDDEQTDASRPAPEPSPAPGLPLAEPGSAPALAPDVPLPAPAPASDVPLPEPAPAPAPAPASELPLAEPAPTTPDAPDAPENVTVVASPTLLPPGTTAHEFDPFAQDLFPPEGAAGTPVPSVDEFTIPDEERGGQASVPTQAIDLPEFLPTQAMDAQEFHPTQAMPIGDGAPAPGPAEPSDDTPPAPASGAAAPGAAADAAAPEVSSTWTDITDLLGAAPETVESSIVPEWPPPEGTFDGFAQAVAPAADVIAQAVAPSAAARQAATRPASAPVEHRRRVPVNRWLIVVVAVLLAVLVAVLLFVVGRAVADSRSATPAAAVSHAASARASASVSPSPAASPTVSATAALPATGTLPAGQTYQWDQLRGGECIDPFGGAWAQQYAVVDCTAQHAAQLVYTAPYSTNPAAAFPGEQAIASQINLLCSKPGVIDMTAAGAYSDLQIVASYPVTAAQWAAGQRNYYCFVTRSSGQVLTSSVQGPGPGQ